MLPNRFEQEMVREVVKRPLDRLPTTAAVISMAVPIKQPSFGRAIPLKDWRSMYLVGAIAAVNFI